MDTLTKDIYLAGGCFWGTEHFFKQVEGVVATEVGFANGHTDNPTYKEVYTDETGYAETVHVRYNPEVVSLEFLLRMFFKAIDPVSLNKQGHDEGTRYRTGIYYTDVEDLPVINQVYDEEQQRHKQPLAVENQPLQRFYTAEEYHQDYLDKNPDGYCHLPTSLFEFARNAKDIKTKNQKNMATIFDFKALNNKGIEVDMSQYSGNVLLIVNTASKCGFTPQYDGLEALYQKYKDQGLVILGFPCDQFANQEPGSDAEIAEFCRLNHGVTFPLMKKIDVNGAEASPIFEFLKSQAPTEEYKGLKAKAAATLFKKISKSVEKESDIKWNFTKFLISKDGSVIKRFPPTTEPSDFEKDIQEMLG